jgi:hypothetical protein
MRFIRIGAVLGVLIAVGLATSTAALASGAGAVSFTQPIHNLTEVNHDVVPCVGPATFTTVSNGALHVTFLTSGPGAGTFWFTITETGSISVVPDDPSAPTFTGHFTFWDGDNGNLSSATSTTTIAVQLVGSDGSVIHGHFDQHVTVTPTGATISFDHLVC